MRSYIGIIHKDPDSCYGVSFPDFPGCITAGDTPDEARAMAAEALAFHVEDFDAHGEVMPEPSTLEQVMQDPIRRAHQVGACQYYLAKRSSRTDR